MIQKLQIIWLIFILISIYIHEVLTVCLLIMYTIWVMYSLRKKIPYKESVEQYNATNNFNTISQFSIPLNVDKYQDNTWDSNNLTIKMTKLPGSVCDVQGMDEDGLQGFE